jgi:MoxR-like ATPase
MNTQASYEYTFVEEADYSFSKEQRTDPDPKNGRCYEEYFPDKDLVEAVQLAIDLQQPLLLEGEPGCGKTQLASAIAYQLTQTNRQKKTIADEEWWPFYTWTVKSYSRARDGLYTFDAIGRLRDAQLMGSNVGGMLDAKTIAEIKDPKTYRTFGALGKALYDKKTKKAPEKRAVVLIDEVDKADSDFTNDLLLELDEFRFYIPETDEPINPPPEPPIVILTSNREKPLPDAFLRRCLYFKIKFPEHDLKRIAQKRLLNLVVTQDAFIQPIIDRFLGVRQAMNQPGSRAPGTSEFLKLLEAVDRRFSKVKTMDIEGLHAILDELPSSLPLLGTLLKTEADQQLYRSKVQKRSSPEDAG